MNNTIRASGIRVSLGVLLFVFFSSFFFAPPDACAVQVKRVQSGEVYFDANDIAQAAKITAVDQTKSIILLYPYSDNNVANLPQNTLYTADFESNSNIVITRDTGSVGCTVHYYVIEFVDGVNVQRGISSFAPGSYTNPDYTTKQISLPNSLTNYQNAFVIVQARGIINSRSADEMATVTGYVSNNNTVNLERYESNVLLQSVNVVWQVVEFLHQDTNYPDFSTWSGLTTIAINEYAHTATLNPAISDLNKAFLFFNFKAGRAVDGYEPRFRTRGEITNATTLTFTRSNDIGSVANNFIDVHWFVIELKDPSSYIQKATATIPSLTDTVIPNLNPAIDLTRSFPVVSISGPNYTAAMSDNNTNVWEDETCLSPMFDSTRATIYDNVHDRIWVLNFNSNSLSRIVPSTGVIEATYPNNAGGKSPRAICFDSQTNSIWIANYNTNNVTKMSVIDGSTTLVALPANGLGPIDICYDVTNQYVWTANYGSNDQNAVTRINVNTNAAVNIQGPYNNTTVYNACAIGYDPVLSYVWMAYASSSYAVRYVAGAYSNAWSILGSGYNYSRLVYAKTSTTTLGYDTMWLVSPRNNIAYRFRSSTGGSAAAFATDLTPQSIAWDANLKVMWVTCYGSNGLLKMDSKLANGSDAIMATYTTGINPWGIALDSANKLWVANSSDDDISRWTNAGVREGDFTKDATNSVFYLSRYNSNTTYNSVAADVFASWFMPQLSPLHLTKPNGGEILRVGAVGTSQNITWTHADALNSSTCDLLLSSDGGATYPVTIASGVNVSDNSYAWGGAGGIPASQGGVNLLQNDLRIRIIVSGSVVGDRKYDDSNGDFEIKGNLTVTTPNTAVTWLVADPTSRNIVWAKNGNFDNTATPAYKFSINLSENGGSSYATNIATGLNQSDLCTGDTCTYPWPIPDKIGTDRRIQVLVQRTAPITAFANAGGGKVTATSNSHGCKNGESIVISGNASYNGTYTISNVTANTFDFVKAFVATGTGTYTTANWDVHDESDVNFTILGRIQVTVPNGAEQWLATENKDIKWKQWGTFSAFTIKYSMNSGSDYPLTVTTGAPAGPCTDGSECGSYTWNNIPISAIGDNTRIKVISEPVGGALSAEDASDADFRIVPSIRVDSPTSASVWKVSESADITWTLFGSVSQVNLWYSKDGGAWQLINTGGPINAAAGTYNWGSIPDIVSTNVKIRINKHNVTPDSTTVPYSDSGAFTVKGKLVMGLPNGGETWNVGTSQNITWTGIGTMTGKIRIKFAQNGTDFTTDLVTEGDNLNYAAGAQSWAWNPILDLVTSTGKVRVELSTDPSNVFCQSGANFTIKGSLHLTAPNGGQSFSVNQANQTISWTATGTVGNVELRYSTDSGSTYPAGNVIATGLAQGASPYNTWTIPDAISNNCKVRVAKVGDEALSDDSDAIFAIRGALDLTHPDGGDIWEVGTSHSITWTRQGSSMGDIRIDYSTNGGADYTNIVPSTPSSALTYPWTIPDAIGNQLRVKIALLADPDNTKDQSQANFTIRGRLILSLPAGGETLEVGHNFNITWDTYGSIANVKLFYSTDGGSTYPHILPPANPQSNIDGFNWTIPDAIGTNTISVRVEDNNDSSAKSDSATFSIKGRVIVTYPTDAGVVWRVGEVRNITWTPYGTIGTVKLEYSTNGGSSYNQIPGATNIPATDGTWPWTVPDLIGNNLKVRVVCESDGTVKDDSDNAFSIKGTLVLTAPNGNAIYYVGDSTNITWTKTGSIGNVELRYSTDGGTSYPDGNIIATAVDPVSGTPHSWSVPDAMGSQVKVKVLLLSDPTGVYDDSNANFTIKGKLQLSSPNGTESWEVGTTRNITWIRTGSIANVKLKYSTDGGSTYPDGNTIIASTSAAPQSYVWTIPDVISTQLRIRVSDVLNDDVNDTSDANFSIKGKLVVISPNGGETFSVGDSCSIAWNSYGTISQVKLLYSTDGGSTYPSVIGVPPIANSSPYAWTMPDIIGTHVRVRVENFADSNVGDNSDADFTVKGSITVQSPNGGEAWLVTTPHNITWAKNGSLGNLTIKLSTDAGATYPTTIATDVASGDLAYPWAVSDNITANAKIKIIQQSDTSVFDESNNVFAINGEVTVTSPDGGEPLNIGGSHDVTWTRKGSIGNVKIEYSVDAGATYPYTIVGSVNSALGTYAWTPIGNTPTTQGRVKITSLSYETINDISNANFGIKASLVLTSPNGGQNWIVGSAHPVTWTKNGSISDVAIDYSTDSGVTWPGVVVADTSGEALSYGWTIPDAIGNKVRVRVRNLADSTVTDASDGDFNIKGALTVTRPNSGEVFAVATVEAVTWTRIGSIQNVKILYSTDSGSTYPDPANLIVASTPAGNLSYNWTVPDAISSTCKVKILDASDSSVFDVSDGLFKIRGTLTVVAPNGGEAWSINSSQQVQWSRIGSIANVKLEYSTNGFATEDYTALIVGSIDATGVPSGSYKYDWTIPDAPGTNVKVRVSVPTDSTVFDVSNNPFSIKGTLAITSPNGTEQWVVGSVHNITWTKFGNIANVKLVYSTDGGSTYPEPANLIVASTPASDLSYSWTIPDAITNQARVKILDAGDLTVTDVSDANFVIKGSVSLLVPNGGQNWLVGDSQNITWSRTGSFANVKLEYSTNGFANESQTVVITNSTPAAGGSYGWTVADAIGTNLKVRITDTANATVTDTSDNPFTIKGALFLNSPNGSETWIVGESRNITWTRTGSIANVKLEYSTDGGTNYNFTIIGSTPAGAGSYGWTVPDAMGSAVRVRVSDVSDSTVLDTSNADFTIKGSLTLTSPNGAEVWVVGDSQDITWTKTGSISTVKLEYSTNGFSDELQTTVIAASTNATGTPPGSYKYTWTVANAISTTLKVRISNTADSAVNDVSNNFFKIKGAFRLTSPNGGENWAVGTSHSVTWTRTGSITNAKLEFSVNAGPYTNSIVGSTPAGGLSYDWTIPDNISTQVRVKISDVDDATVYDTSDADFAIMGAFTISTPNGSEVWVVNSPHDIAWATTGTVSNVKLEYSTDSGLTYPNVIVGSTGNNSPYNWTVPDAISNTVRVKISDAGNANAFDTSNANFKIKGALTLATPNGSEAWAVASHNNITWTRTGSVANVKLEYSTNGFSDESQTVTIVASTPGAALVYDWTIPDAPSSTVKVRISDAADVTVFDLSNADFRIIGSLTITSPNGTEQWVVGENRNITWTKFGNIANVKLMYSTDGGATYPVGKTIVASTSAAPLSYTWTIPDDITSQGRVKISDVNDGTVTDQSDANFTIKGSVTLTAPNGGENLVVGASQNITWTRNGSFANVKLEYSRNAFSDELQVTTITGSTPAAAGTYSWTVADAIGTNLKVRVSDAANASVSDVSNNPFTIKGALSLNVPNGTETWVVGESRNITWARTGSIANVKLEYSTNGGTTYPNLIIASTPAGALSYGWTVADAIGGDVRVRVSDAADATVLDTSDASFTIKGALTVTAPNGNEVWVVDSSHNITWTRTGSIANVKLEYSTNGFADELQTTVITNSTDASTGTYSWTVPDAINNTVKVRVTNTADNTVKDVSDLTFRIIGAVALTAPNGAEKWKVGESHNITWTRTGSIANVKLEYSTNGGASYAYTITNSTPAGGLSYSWNPIPDTISPQVKVKISDAAEAGVFDVSDSNFAIMGGFTILSPNGAEVWVVNDSHDITWTTNGTVSNIKLEYSTDGGSTYPNVIIASTPNNNSYAWTVPDAISITVKVRVSDAANGDAFDTSNGNFKIKGSLTVTSPNNGTESWSVGYSHPITWTRTGSVQFVNFYYSANAGVDWTAAINGAPVDASLGTWNWNMPGDTELSTQARIKITDTSDATVTDSSNNNFEVKGGIAVNTPDATGISLQVGNNYSITWTKYGNIPNVQIHYSTNGGIVGGGTYPDPANLIAVVPASDQAFLWDIPDAIGTNVRIRVRQADNFNVWDESANAFEIKGKLQVVTPNGGEVWFVGENNNIQWIPTGTFTSQVKLEYSTNAFANESQTVFIATVPAGTNGVTQNYPWSVANAIGGNLKVRATDANNATVTDVSNNPFTIKGKLRLMQPNGGETWTVGTSQNITWQRTGTIALVDFKYSTDNGSTYPGSIATSIDGSLGAYGWTIPDIIGSNVRVKILDHNDPTVEDVSDNTFTVKGALILTAPNGAEAWQIGTSRNITWTRAGSVANVKLEFSLDGGATYPTTIVASTDGSTGTYPWLIPDNPCSTVKVRITDTSDPTVFDISNANFKIIGSLTLTTPNGTEMWGIQQDKIIRWTKTGSMANVKLQYSTNSGASYDYLIVASTPCGALEYTWNVSDTPSTHARIKISDASDVTVADESDADFKIQGRFTITSPDGSEVWTVGDSQNITWTSIGSVTNVKLEYSTNGGATYPNTIAASIGNTGSYSWTVPDAISAQVRVRLSDVNDYDAADASNGNFKIRGSLLLTSPNGTEIWVVGSSHACTWTRTGSVQFVRLDYSTDGGATYPNNIANNVDASLGTTNWTIPDAIGSQLRVKITDTSDSTVYDTSNANFTIKGALTVTSPNGGENWIVASGHAITWTRTGSIANVKIDYSKNGGASYPNPIVASTDASTGSYAWTIPDDLSTTVRIRVSDASDASVYDDSNANFSIGGALTVNSPNGGQIWYVAENHNITWTRFGSIPTVKLEYSTDSGATYPNIIIASTDASTGTYAWSVPDAIGTHVRVKVTDTANAAVTDTSDADFEIKGVLLLTSPNGAETWIVGSTHAITWTPTGTIPTVKLEYSIDGGNTYPNTIIASTSGPAGTYSWTVADAIGTNLKVRVTNTADASVNDVSNNTFNVKGSITVTSPNGGESWGVGTAHNITWTKTGTFATVKIEYSTDGGTTYPNTIIASIDASSGTHSWNIPDSISSQARVKVTNNADASVNDASDTNFKIVGILALTAPNGTERWTVGSNNNITWTRSGSIANAKLQYSTDGGATFPNTIIASTPAGALSFTWNVNDTVSKTCRVRISDVTDITVYDDSNANFTIQAGFTISSPNGGEVYGVGSSTSITWTTIGTANTVALDYTKDGGTIWNSITGSTLNTGSFSWTIPDAISTTCKVRVSDFNDANANDASNNNFKIRGDIVITSPDGSEAWIVGSVHNVTWTMQGTLNRVDINYSTDGGATYTKSVASNILATDLSYAWTIPNDLSQICRVKITDTADSMTFDASNANFKIRGDFVLTSPNGAEVWNVASVHNVTWTRTGGVANAKLEYSTDGGNTYPSVIVASTDASALSYAWLIPDTISTLVRVRISDASDATVNDTSNANFKIRGSFTITSPNGSEEWEVSSNHNITWTYTGTIGNVKLEYSTDAGVSYPFTIVASVPCSDRSYGWTIPDAIGTQARAKITNLADLTVNDESDANFKIKGKLVVISPNGGEVWPVGSTQAVSWSRVGSVANVKLEYSQDGGATFPGMIIASTPAAAGSYSWVIPDVIASTMRVRASDVSDASVFDVSDANFKIRGDLTLTSPNGAEIWLINQNRNITWTRFGSIANAKLEYSVDGGATYPFTIVGSISAALQTYGWTIPDNPTVQGRVRISDAADPLVYDTSNANFTIRGGFVITAPNGAESWAVSSTQNITWTTFGSYANVKLWYSTDNGATYPNIITGNTANSGIFGWTVPDAISATCKVKIADLVDINATDESDAAFKIHGVLTITSPNGGEQWGVGTSHNITWTRVGSVATARLEYSTDGGTTYPNLINANVTASNLSYSWTVPDAIGNALKVKISVADDGSVFDVSDSVFTIRGTITVTAPNGGESWIVGSSHNITWTSLGSIANVKLDYSTDGGTTFNSIIASVANSGTYGWTVPDAISAQSRIKVSNVLDPNTFDVSDNNFKIRGDLVITAPNGGEKWPIGTNQLITWSRTGSIANVRLEYSDNGGTTYVPIVPSTPNAGSYSWNVPDAITTLALVRIYDASDLTISDVSNAMFKIQGSFTVTSPNGGEAWGAASNHNITWTWNGSIGFVNLYYSKDSGVTWVNIVLSAANTGTYDWFIPVEAVSTQCRVKVASSADTDAMDTSNNDFRVRCSFVLTAPNGGEQWRTGRTYNITWNKVGNPAAVRLEYAPDNFLDPGQTVLINGAASPTSPYAWTIPNYICNTTRVRIADAADYGARDDSDANFRITGDVTVTAPNGSEKWAYDTVHNITWTTAGTISNVKIEYSSNGGADYTTIDAVANSGSYPWTIPNTISQNCLVRISDLSDATADDVSNAVFKIIARFTLTAPNGSEVWTVGETHPVTWTSLGTVANVKLSYSTDGGATFPNTIIASTPNNGSYDWTIPDAISTTVRVKVESAIDPDAFDVSDANFKIRGKFTVTAPNGGDEWEINQNKTITWTTTGTIANVRILYSTDSGATYPNTIINSVANTGSYSWLVPDNRTALARIRVINPADVTVYDDSDADFSIRGFLTLTSPTGGEVWTSEDSHNITWTWGGTLPTVKLTYSTDAGATYPYTINAAAPNGAGGGGSYSYAWTVPNTLSHTCRVKVEDPLVPAVFNVSNADFRITGTISVTAPVGGERWVTNETHAITWTNKGSIPNVKITYSKDNFATSSTVVVSVANSNSFNWVIPDDRSATVKVRVLDASDETIYGTSPADFRIDYYNITWDIRDLLTNQRLTNLSVTEKDTAFSTVTWNATALTAPIVHQSAYGNWTTVWSSTGYGDKGQNFTADHDQSFTVYLETSAVHIWESKAEFTYDATGDNLKATAWLQRDGSVVTGAAKIGVYIYDGNGVPISYNAICDPDFYNFDSNSDGTKDQCNPRPTLYSTTIDPSGYFYLTLPAPTNLQAGVVYAALVDITNLSGAHFRTPTSFSVTESKRLESTESTVKNMEQVTLPAFQVAVQNTITTGINEQKQTITDIMVGKGGDPESVMNSGGMVGMLQNSLTSFEQSTTTAIKTLQSGAQTAVEAGQQLQATAKKFSWRGSVSPDPALTGDTIALQVQGQPSLLPLVSVYTWDSKALYTDTMMTETRPGFYIFEFKADQRFTPGKAYTYMVAEQVTGGLVSGSGMVESMGITTVAGLAAAAPEAERAAKQALDAIKAVESVIVSKENINISMTLKNLKESVDALPQQLSKEGPNAAMMNAINDISTRLNKIMGSEGMDFSSLLDEKLGDASTLKQMRNKTDTISSIVDLLLQIMEARMGGVDAPIVSTSLQAGSVKFRIVAINPSKTKTQKVQLKKYLPEEVKPKDVMDLGGLELEYDAEKGIYYVYRNDLDLQPNEVRSYEVEVEDIWVIPDNQIADLKKQTDAMLARFAKTALYTQAKEITDTIYPVLEEMPKAQVDESISREQHIGIYRQNTLNIQRIKEKLAELEKKLQPQPGTMTPEALEKNKFKVNLPTKSTTWLIILIVVVFLGLFAGIFFFVWQGQIRASQDLIKETAKQSFPGKKPEEKSQAPPEKK